MAPRLGSVRQASAWWHRGRRLTAPRRLC